MGRGLGERQRNVLARLEAAPEGEYVALWELADDPDDPNEMAKARSAVRGLERRGLVMTMTETDERRQIETTVIYAETDADWTVTYQPTLSSRAWHGLFARLRRPNR